METRAGKSAGASSSAGTKRPPAKPNSSARSHGPSIMTEAQRQRVLYALIATIICSVGIVCMLISAFYATRAMSSTQPPHRIQLADAFSGGQAHRSFASVSQTTVLFWLTTADINECATSCVARSECVAIEYTEASGKCLGAQSGYTTMYTPGTSVYFRKFNVHPQHQPAVDEEQSVVTLDTLDVVFAVVANSATFGNRGKVAMQTWLAHEESILLLDSTMAAQNAAKYALHVNTIRRSGDHRIANQYNGTGKIALRLYESPKRRDDNGAWKSLKFVQQATQFYPHAAWFMLVDDATAVIPINLRRVLRKLADQSASPLLLCGALDDTPQTSIFSLKGSGVLLSASAARLFTKEVVEDCEGSCVDVNADSRLLCCARRQGVKEMKSPLLYSAPPRDVLREGVLSGIASLDFYDSYPVSFHGLEDKDVTLDFWRAATQCVRPSTVPCVPPTEINWRTLSASFGAS